jgi:acyl-CoA synthetase (AMP-forming)/AMP-acid ligase II
MRMKKVLYNDDSPDSDALILVKGRNTRTIRKRGALSRNVGKLSAFLVGRAVEKGDRILILAGTCIESVELVLASLNIGAVAVPINPFAGKEVLARLIDTVRPSVCLVGDDLSLEMSALAADRCGTMVYVAGRERRLAAKEFCYEQILNDEAADYEIRHTNKDELALIVHTSGSQGRPKSISFTHEDLWNCLERHDYLYSQYISERELESGILSPFVSPLPLDHLGGLAICLQGLMMSRPTYLLSHFTPRSYLELIEETRCSVTMLVPSMYASLLSEVPNANRNFDALTYCVTLGEPCTPELAQRIAATFGATVTSAYGLTECQTGLGFTRDDLIEGNVRPGSCGRLLYGEIKLVGEQGEESEWGELWVKNETVRECYADDSMNRAKIANGWFRTGDLFYRDREGFHFYKGRVDNMFICSGKNTYPQEIEDLLQGHRAVDRACVVPIVDPSGTTVVTALVKVREATAEEEIIDHCLKTGSSHAVPRLIKIVDQIPETGPSKIDRQACRAILEREYERRRAIQAAIVDARR